MHRYNQTNSSSPKKDVYRHLLSKHGRLNGKAGLKARRVVNKHHVELAHVLCASRLLDAKRHVWSTREAHTVVNVLLTLSAAGFKRCNVDHIHKLLYHVEQKLTILARN